MVTWGLVVILFAGMWVLQIVLTLMQSRHYYQQLRVMQQQQSGYLGVGVKKRRFGVGAVVILVTDRNGIVTQCKRMSGISVFSRFRLYPELVGKSIDSLYLTDPQISSHSTHTAVRIAIEQIRSAQSKQLQDQV